MQKALLASCVLEQESSRRAVMGALRALGPVVNLGLWGRVVSSQTIHLGPLASGA